MIGNGIFFVSMEQRWGDIRWTIGSVEELNRVTGHSRVDDVTLIVRFWVTPSSMLVADSAGYFVGFSSVCAVEVYAHGRNF